MDGWVGGKKGDKGKALFPLRQQNKIIMYSVLIRVCTVDTVLNVKADAEISTIHHGQITKW